MMDNITKTSINVEATAGAEFDCCVRDAIILAMQESIVVELLHNQRLVHIYPKDIMQFILQPEAE